MSHLEGEALAAWLRQRAGKLTASRMNTAMAFNKDGQPSKARTDYAKELVAERVTGDSVKHYVNPAMQWGLDTEDEAAGWYEAKTGSLLLPSRFYDHPTIDNLGCTPDVEVDDDEGLVEIKCPTTVVYMDWFRTRAVPEEHKPQMIVQLQCTKRAYVDFVAYDPRIRYADKRGFIVRYQPTEEEVVNVMTHAVKFLAEVDAIFEEFVGMA